MTSVHACVCVQVTIDELRECIVRLVRERRELVCEVEEQGRRVEACRRERLQALEERDHHLHRSHTHTPTHSHDAHWHVCVHATSALLYRHLSSVQHS